MDRRDLLQHWPETPRKTVDVGLPKPWVVAASSNKDLHNLLIDAYGAHYLNSRYDIPGGELVRVIDPYMIHGFEHGTLFVLFGVEDNPRLGKIIEFARVRGLQIVPL